MKNFKRGFTLIELLIVVAIIGILASIVLTSLSNARNKGNDTKIKSQLYSIRSATELYYSNNNTYKKVAGTNEVCHPPASDTSGLSALLNLNNYPAGTVLDCGNSANAWSVAASMSGDSWPGCEATTSCSTWCVDSTGVSKGTYLYNGATGPYKYGLWGTFYAAHQFQGATVCQ